MLRTLRYTLQATTRATILAGHPSMFLSWRMISILINDHSHWPNCNWCNEDSNSREVANSPQNKESPDSDSGLGDEYVRQPRRLKRVYRRDLIEVFPIEIAGPDASHQKTSVSKPSATKTSKPSCTPSPTTYMAPSASKYRA